jgi:GDP-4-dehydro-6-deoxy-D-mannose reductase
VGIDRWPECAISAITYATADILDTPSLVRLLDTHKPDRIYHLAAVSYLPDADATPRHALETNILGAVSLLDAMRNSCPQARALLVGSSKEYGSDANAASIEENAQPRPTDFYALSKYAAELAGQQYARQYGLDVRFSRSFNHTGPGQSPRFVCSDWARQAALITLGQSAPVIQIGDTRHEVDFLDVHDVANAYFHILERGERGVIYNVCSGTAVSLHYIISYLVHKIPVAVEIRPTEMKFRAHRASLRLAGDNSRIRKQTGWSPSIPLETTLDDLYAYWMRRCSEKNAAAIRAPEC